MDLHGLLAETLDLHKSFERSRRATRELEGLTVGAQYIGRQAEAPGRIAAPVHDSLIARRLDFIQLAEQRGKSRVGRVWRLAFPRSRVRQRRQGLGRRSTLQHAGFQVDGAARPAIVLEEMRFGAKHFALGEVAGQRFVVKETRARVEGDGDDADFTHGFDRSATAWSRQSCKRLIRIRIVP